MFLSYLVAGLKSIHPKFGDKTLSHIETASNIREQSRVILSTFISELDELVGEELFIALDDFHLVNESPQIIEAMDFLLNHMLPNLHFIILSRSALALNQTSLKARRELLELQESHLRFTTEEATRLFNSVFDMQLSREDLEALSESMEGWITGLVLFYLALKDKDSTAARKAVKESGASLTDVVDYLSQTVYGNLPEVVRDFATRTSLLSRMNPQFCNELLEIDDSKAILDYLISERLFTIPLDDAGEWFRYHHQVQSFLRDILRETLSREEARELHLKAAALWEKSGEHEEALGHYLEAQSYDRAAGILVGIFNDLLSANRLTALNREILRLPQGVLREQPMLMLFDTQLGGFDPVMADAEASSEKFEEAGESENRVWSLVRLAQAYFVTGKLDEAGETAARVSAAMPQGSPYRYELAATEGMIAAFVGQVGEADHFLDEVFQHRDELKGMEPETRTLAYCSLALLLQGKFHRAIELFYEVDRLLETTGLASTGIPILYGFISRAFSYLDRLEKAVETAGKAVALGERHGVPPMVFLNRAARAVALAFLGERGKAIEDASVAASVCDKYGFGPQVIYSEWYLGEAYGLAGDKATALKHLDRAALLLEHYGDARYVMRLLSISFTYQDLGLEASIKEVKNILKAVRQSGMGVARSIAFSLLFNLELASGSPDKAKAALEEYISEFGEDIILRSCTPEVGQLLPFFAELFSAGEHLELMERVFGIGGAKGVQYLKTLEKSADARVSARAQGLFKYVSRESVEPLVINILGPFQLRRGEQVLSSGEWKSKKALTVLKYLSLNRGKGFVPRDVLMDLLWPDVPPDSAAKSLNAALTSLRKTLEPEASRGESSYLVTKGDSLLLELGAGGWTDHELFREKLARAADAREAGDFDLYFNILKEADDLYRGEFCCEDLYEDWCLFEREALEAEYLDLAVNLATELLRRGDGAGALSHLEKAIAKDPGREELYRKQMIICSRTGNRAGIESAFKRCREYLKENFEVAPSPETTELYERLRKE